jgi:hypothetical protein
MKLSQVSKDNQLTKYIDFKQARYISRKCRVRKDEICILVPHYSINIARNYQDQEALQYDLDELSDYLGQFVYVSDYDDLCTDPHEANY